MRRLKWVPIILCLLLIALAGIAVIYGRTLPSVSSGGVQAAGLDVCDGKLCLLHIVPGTTSYHEAKQTLAEYITRDEGDHFHGQMGEFALRVTMDSTGVQIREVDVQGSSNNRYSRAIPFSKIIDQFGIPCNVIDIRPGNGGIDLAYPSFRVWVLPDQNHITLQSPIGGITLADGSDLSLDNRSCDNIVSGMPWRGFASLQLYQALQRDSGVIPLNERYSYPGNSSPSMRPPYGP